MGDDCEITLTPTLVAKIQSYMNDPIYRETIENASSFNHRLSVDRTSRLPFLDSQTGVAQNHSSLWMDARERLPGQKEGQVYTYPSKRWKKKRRQYLTNFMQPRYPYGMMRKETPDDSEPPVITETGNTNNNILPGISSEEPKEIQPKEEVKPPEAWYYDDLDIPDSGEFDEPDADSDYDYEESYSSKKKKKKTTTPKAPRQTNTRGRRKITYDAVTDPEKPFSCDICGARYKTRPGLTYHYTHSHKDKEEEEDDEMKRDDGSAVRRHNNHRGPGLPPPILHPQQQHPMTQQLQPPTLQPQQPPPHHHMSGMNMGIPGQHHPNMMMPQHHLSHGHHPPPPHLIPQQPPPPHLMTHQNIPPNLQQPPRHSPPPHQQQMMGGVCPSPPISIPGPSHQNPQPLNTEDQSKKLQEPNSQKPRVQPSLYCDFCLGDAGENKKSGSPEELVSCSDCGRSGHPTCLQFTMNMIVSVKKYRWQCIECKCCSICGNSDNDDQLLFCDDCDRGYHMYCLTPPLDAPPEGSWSCSLCIAEFHHGR